MPRLVTESVAQRLAESQTDVLDGVVLVDLEIAARLHGQIEEPVPREAVEHVVEERHTGLDDRLAAAVDVDLDLHVGLFGLAADLRVASLLARHPSSSDCPHPGADRERRTPQNAAPRAGPPNLSPVAAKSSNENRRVPTPVRTAKIRNHR